MLSATSSLTRPAPVRAETRRSLFHIHVEVFPEMIHVFHAFAPMLPEAMPAIEQIVFLVGRRRQALKALPHDHVTGGAGAVSAARVVERNAKVQGDVEDRFFFAVIFVGELAVLERYGFALGEEGYLDKVFGRGFGRRGSRTLSLFF